jgi:hypothetical protein
MGFNSAFKGLRRLDSLKNATHDTGNEESSGIAPAVAESREGELQQETTLVFTLARYCCIDDKWTNRHFLQPNDYLSKYVTETEHPTKRNGYTLDQSKQRKVGMSRSLKHTQMGHRQAEVLPNHLIHFMRTADGQLPEHC